MSGPSCFAQPRLASSMDWIAPYRLSSWKSRSAIDWSNVGQPPRVQSVGSIAPACAVSPSAVRQLREPASRLGGGRRGSRRGWAGRWRRRSPAPRRDRRSGRSAARWPCRSRPRARPDGPAPPGTASGSTLARSSFCFRRAASSKSEGSTRSSRSTCRRPHRSATMRPNTLRAAALRCASQSRLAPPHSPGSSVSRYTGTLAPKSRRVSSSMLGAMPHVSRSHSLVM